MNYLRAEPKVFILILINLFFFSANIFSQRIVQYDQFSSEYFDSIRALIYHDTVEHWTINAYRLQSPDEIIIDGNLDETAWQKAERRGGFLEKEPYPLVPESEPTEFAILYDDHNLYIGVWCRDSEPGKIKRELAPRGTTAPDHIMIFLDTFHDHRTGYKFAISATGVQDDELRYDDIGRDGSWNGIWESASSIDEKGWYAEVKIPFFNLRFFDKEIHTWGFNLMRVISKDSSRSQWKPHLPEWEVTTRMSQNGHIENIKDISSGRTFEMRPFGLAGTTRSMQLDPASTLNIGGDVRFSLTPGITVDFALNPDFAQVDADVFEINLERFPTRFDELRPFFTERTTIFNTPKELFYSRRIGAQSDILGGIKATGKLQNGFEFGVIGNLTGNSILSSSIQNHENATFGVFRVKKDILNSSNLGILAATKEKPNEFNRILGIDGNFMLKNNILDFQVATGQTELAVNQNMMYHLTFTQTGDEMGMILKFDRIEPAFEINRIGYIRKEPDRGWNKGGGIIRYSPRINKYHIRRIILNAEFNYTNDIFTKRYINHWLERYPNFSPDPLFGDVMFADDTRLIDGGIRHINNFDIGSDLTINLINRMSFSAEYRRFSESELTGKYYGDNLEMSYSTRPLRAGARFAGTFSSGIGTFYNYDQKYPGRKRSLSIDGEGRLSYHLVTRLQAGLVKTYDLMNNNDGRYYNLSANAIWMFTKDFYLRVHAQGIFETTYYGHKQTGNEYLLSGLLSWEYKPGSFIYFAYNEGRFDESNPTRSRFFEFNNRTAVLKLSYFFNI